MPKPEHSEQSSVIHGGQNPDQPEVGFPGSGFHHTSTFQLPYVDDLNADSYDEKNEDYGRQGHPYSQILEDQVSALEHASHTVVYGSGIAAINAICMTLKSGDLILAEENTYGCTIRLWREELAKFGISVKYFDFSSDHSLVEIAKSRPQIVWIESPTNPMLKIIDIKKVAEHTRKAGATLVVDNSFASSWLQQPLDLGADISVVSLTKYADGHSSSMGGAACTNNSEWGERLLFQRKALGLHLSPDEAERISQGLKTLVVRMERHCENALTVAQHLEQHDAVRSVIYPFLTSHKHYEVSRRQMKGGSGIITFDLVTPAEKVQDFLRDLYPMFKKTHSLGSVACSVSVPGSMSHASLSAEQRKVVQISPTTIRLSIGIEPVDDIIKQLDYALARAKARNSTLSESHGRSK
jgi:cystathionine beta-lyase/cystathionine gamma-synthase